MTCWRCAGPRGLTRSVLCAACHARLKAEGLRWCGRCLRALPASAFGSTIRCRRCDAAYHEAWRQAHPRQYDNAARRARYATDPTHREARKASARISERSRRRRTG